MNLGRPLISVKPHYSDPHPIMLFVLTKDLLGEGVLPNVWVVNLLCCFADVVPSSPCSSLMGVPIKLSINSFCYQDWLDCWKSCESLILWFGLKLLMLKGTSTEALRLLGLLLTAWRTMGGWECAEAVSSNSEETGLNTFISTSASSISSSLQSWLRLSLIFFKRCLIKCWWTFGWWGVWCLWK